MTLQSTPSSWEAKAAPFSGLVDRVRAYAEGCFDQSSESRGLGYEAGDVLRYVGVDAGAGELFGEPAAVEQRGQLTGHALGQLVERLDGPPMRWLGDERHTDSLLRADVMNALIRRRESSDLLVRRRGELVRAILSDEYSPFSHVDFLDLVGGALGQLGDLGRDARVHNAQVGDELRAYVLLPRVVFGADPGAGRGGNGSPALGGGPNGALHPAVYVSNSEIGTGKVRIHGGLFRVVCSNGAIRWQSDEGGLELVHRGLSARTIAHAVADALVSALKLSEDLARVFLASQAVLVAPGRIEALCKSWGDKYGLSVGTVDEWRAMVAPEAIHNGRGGEGEAVALFDVVNAATYAAHKLTPAEREQVERMAGDLVYADVSRYAGAPVRQAAQVEPW